MIGNRLMMAAANRDAGPNFIPTPATGWEQKYGSGGATFSPGTFTMVSGSTRVWSNNIAMQGDFIFEWNWSAIATSGVGFNIGWGPWSPSSLDTYGMWTNYESGIPTNDWCFIADRADSNTYHVSQDGYIKNYSFFSGARTTNTFRFKRVGTVFSLTDGDDALLYTFPNPSTGVDIALGCGFSTLHAGHRLENMQYADNL